MTPTLRAVLFDLDGTLADTEPLWLSAKATVAARYGIPWSTADGIASIGQATPVYSREFVRRGADATPERIAQEITHDVASAVERGPSWRPGALDLLDRVVRHGCRTALVTMAYRPVAEALERAAARPVFDVIVAGDDVTLAKPHPEPYLAALSALGIHPGAALAVEDSPTGAASALAAGLRVAAVPSMGDMAPRGGLTLFRSLAEVDPAAFDVA
jgi:HAD superfamily hydrolase (TIGR01509 family)